MKDLEAEKHQSVPAGRLGGSESLFRRRGNSFISQICGYQCYTAPGQALYKRFLQQTNKVFAKAQNSSCQKYEKLILVNATVTSALPFGW